MFIFAVSTLDCIAVLPLTSLPSPATQKDFFPASTLWATYRQDKGASQVAQLVKNLPPNAGDTRDLGSILSQEDPLKEEMAPHSCILSWKIPCTKELGGL